MWKITGCSLGALKVMHIIFLPNQKLVPDYSTPPYATVNSAYYVALWCNTVWPVLHSKQSNCQNNLFQNNTAPHCYHKVHGYLQACVCGGVSTPLYILVTSPMALLSIWSGDEVTLGKPVSIQKCHNQECQHHYITCKQRQLQHCNWLSHRQKCVDFGSNYIKQGRDASMLWHIAY